MILTGYRTLLAFICLVGSDAFLTQPKSLRHTDLLNAPFSPLCTKDADTTDNTDIDTEEVPFLALPGAGGSSFDPLKSENRFASVAQGKDLKDSKFVSDKFELLYTCKKCETRNSNKVSRIAYRNGVVIVVCKGCMAKHLIADNLGWHNYIGGFEGQNDIESYLASRGREEDIDRVPPDVFELEQLLSSSPPESEGDGEQEME